MRIISGRFRGRRLKGPRGLALRPTGDRLKETLFNILGSSIRDSVFLDLFAGTGAIGLEALSRGARKVLFVESSPEGLRLIRENLKVCGVTGGFDLVNIDVFKALRQLAKSGMCADIIFVDPPYEWQPYRDLLEIVFRTGLAGTESLVIVEHHQKSSLPAQGEDYSRTRVVEQSDKCLSFYRARLLGSDHNNCSHYN